MQQSLRNFLKPRKQVENKEQKLFSYAIIGISYNLVDLLDEYEAHFFNSKHFPTEEERESVRKLIDLCESFNSTVSKVVKVRKSDFCINLSNKIMEIIDGYNLDGIEKMCIMIEAIMVISDDAQPEAKRRMRNIEQHCCNIFLNSMSKRGHTVSKSQIQELVNRTKSIVKKTYVKYDAELS